MKVFVDSDVVISSLLSESGAAHFLTYSTNIQPFVSNVSYEEMKIVSERLSIEKEKLGALLERRFKEVGLKENLSEIKNKHADYVTDPDDAHIVAAASLSKVEFLITYNQKHFKADKIKNDFGIITMKPALFLQYLRSLEK